MQRVPYEYYQKLLDQKGVKNADVARATGVGDQSLSDWKNGKSSPKSDKLGLIANYFHVSMDYLMYGEDVKNQYSVENAHMVEMIRNDVELSNALMKYFEMSASKKELVVQYINILSKEG